MDFEIVASIDSFSSLYKWFTEEEALEIMKREGDSEGFIILCDGVYSYVSQNVFYASM